MKISKIKIRIHNSDGTFLESETVIPYQIANEIITLATEWKDNWIATTHTVERFQEEEKLYFNNKKE